MSKNETKKVKLENKDKKRTEYKDMQVGDYEINYFESMYLPGVVKKIRNKNQVSISTNTVQINGNVPKSLMKFDMIMMKLLKKLRCP